MVTDKSCGPHLQVWDVRTKDAELHREAAHKGTVRDVDVSSSSNPLIATGGDDCYVRIWDPRSASKITIKYCCFHCGRSRQKDNDLYHKFIDNLFS